MQEMQKLASASADAGNAKTLLLELLFQPREGMARLHCIGSSVTISQ